MTYIADIKIAAGNWKMNMRPSQVTEYFNEFIDRTDFLENSILAVPYIDIIPAINAVKRTPVEIYAQNFYYEEKGAYTGEVSIDMLIDAGVTGVIIGHSERREIFGESNSMINKKVLAAKKAGLKIILCVGEPEHLREIDAHESYIEMQLLTALHGLDDLKNIMFAYEPIWAIGTGKTASCTEAAKMCRYIDDVVSYHYNLDENEATVLYGGSVNENNAKDLFRQKCIGGVLVGGASLIPSKFSKICELR